MVSMKPPRLPENPPPVLGEEQRRALLAAAEGKRFEGAPRFRAPARVHRHGCTARRGHGAALHPCLRRAQRLRPRPGAPARPRQGAQHPPASARNTHRARSVVTSTSGTAIGTRPCVGFGWVPRGASPTPASAQALCRRARQAGLPDVHPHQLRHSFAHDWLANGGSEGDLMRLAGWHSRPMLQRYAASTADDRAATVSERKRPLCGGRSLRATAPPCARRDRLGSEPKEIGPSQVLGPAAPLRGRQGAIRVGLAQESVEKRGARRGGGLAPIAVGVADVGSDTGCHLTAHRTPPTLLAGMPPAGAACRVVGLAPSTVRSSANSRSRLCRCSGASRSSAARARLSASASPPHRRTNPLRRP